MRRIAGILSWLLAFLVGLAAAQTPRASPTSKLDCPTASSESTFSETRESILNGCKRAYSADERLYMAGYAQSMVDTCNLGMANLPDPLRTFLMRSAVSGVMSANTAYVLGNKSFVESQCGTPLVDRWLAAVQASLATPPEAMKSDGSTNFVDSCETYYRGTWSRAKCACLADVGRLTIPSIDTKYFGMDIMQDLRPQSGVLVARCGITDYSQPPAPPQSAQSAKASACHQELRRDRRPGTRTPAMVQEFLKECMNRPNSP